MFGKSSQYVGDKQRDIKGVQGNKRPLGPCAELEHINVNTNANMAVKLRI